MEIVGQFETTSFSHLQNEKFELKKKKLKSSIILTSSNMANNFIQKSFWICDERTMSKVLCIGLIMILKFLKRCNLD